MCVARIGAIEAMARCSTSAPIPMPRSAQRMDAVAPCRPPPSPRRRASPPQARRRSQPPQRHAYAVADGCRRPGRHVCEAATQRRRGPDRARRLWVDRSFASRIPRSALGYRPSDLAADGTETVRALKALVAHHSRSPTRLQAGTRSGGRSSIAAARCWNWWRRPGTGASQFLALRRGAAATRAQRVAILVTACLFLLRKTAYPGYQRAAAWRIVFQIRVSSANLKPGTPVFKHENMRPIVARMLCGFRPSLMAPFSPHGRAAVSARSVGAPRDSRSPGSRSNPLPRRAYWVASARRRKGTTRRGVQPPPYARCAGQLGTGRIRTRSQPNSSTKVSVGKAKVCLSP
jgi:hypothetical protein